MTAEILIVDDDPAARHGLRRALEAVDCRLIEAADGRAALAEIERAPPDLVVCDIRMPKLDGMGLLKELGEKLKELPVVMLTAHGSERIAVEAMKAGAWDYLSKPYDVDELRCVVRNALETVRLRQQNRALRIELNRRTGFGHFVGRSRLMEDVCDLIEKVAPTDATVLVYGESGTGKELVAKALHEHSPRNDGPFIAINSAAVPAELIESELFGHEKGAFTGASARRIGKFQLANCGTIFLDEVGDMAPETQAKLLRVLQERTIERVGGTDPIGVDVRVISASNKDLPAEIEAGRFREDLYYRLKVVDISLPPLRHRPEDIPLLVAHYLDTFNRQHGKELVEIPPEVMRTLIDYPWPGNVRQLMNVLERAVVLATGDRFETDLLPDELRRPAVLEKTNLKITFPEGDNFQETKREIVHSFETSFIENALMRHNGNVSRAAESIGMKRQALQQKIKELDINPNAFRK